jgi:hypothetical protein
MTIENNKHNAIGIMSWYYYVAVLEGLGFKPDSEIFF